MSYLAVSKYYFQLLKYIDREKKIGADVCNIIVSFVLDLYIAEKKEKVTCQIDDSVALYIQDHDYYRFDTGTGFIYRFYPRDVVDYAFSPRNQEFDEIVCFPYSAMGFQHPSLFSILKKQIDKVRRYHKKHYPKCVVLFNFDIALDGKLFSALPIHRDVVFYFDKLYQDWLQSTAMFQYTEKFF